MPVYLFTLHAYRSWNPDNPRGYVVRGRGVQPPNPAMARLASLAASQPPMIFDRDHQQVMLSMIWDACQRRAWRLHYFATEPSHIHVLVSWREYQPWQQVRGKLKNLMSWQLGIQFFNPGRRWFSDEGSRRWVRDRRHFEHLMTRYLPRHSGLKWREGDPLPPPLASASG